MLTLFRPISILIFLTMTSFAYAAPKNTKPDIPRNLHVYNAAGHTYVDLNDDRLNENEGCSGWRYHLAPSHAAYDTIVAILLAAQTPQKTVTIKYDGCSTHTVPQGEIIGVYYEGTG